MFCDLELDRHRWNAYSRITSKMSDATVTWDELTGVDNRDSTLANHQSITQRCHQ